MDFLANQILLKSSKKYSNIYKHFSKNYSIKYHELFAIVSAIGFVNDRKSEPVEKSSGIELRSNYFNNSQKASIYSIILNDYEQGRQIEGFEDKESISKYCKMIEEYAEGGMEILVEEVFKRKWNGIGLDDDYLEYDIDVMSYYLAFHNKVPF